MSIINKNLLKKFDYRFFKLSLFFLFLIFIFGYSPISKKAYAINIYTIEDLDSIRNDLTGDHVLMNDLDFNSDSSYSDPANKISYTTGEGWDPVQSFSGMFDGGGYTISNLFINTSSSSPEVGLFEDISVSSSVFDVGLLGADISAINANKVGSLIGSSNGTVANCYSTGSVAGSIWVGGLVGENYDNGQITNSYSSVVTYGQDDVGGLAGYNKGDVIDSYSTGSVTGAGDVGGLIGLTDVGSVTDSYWDTESSGVASSSGGTGKTTLEMYAIATFTNWDIVDISVFNMLSPSDWYIDEGNDYPRLFWEFEVSFEPVEPPPEVDYTIDSIEDLNNIRYDLAGDYVLTKDLDFNSDASYSDPANKIAYTTGEGWDPIGTYVSGSEFSGTFDGNNFTISNLFIDTSSSSSNFALFGRTLGSSSIFDIGLLNASITAGSAVEVGILVGENGGTISNSYSTGFVVGRVWVGGLVSSNYGTITNSYSNGSVTGDVEIGGLAGYNDGTITNSYSNGSVTGDDEIGGLVGYNDGTITNSYSNGSVTGDDEIGGLVGYNDGTITNSYSNSSVTENDNYRDGWGLGGLVGENYGTITNSYSTGYIDYGAPDKVGGLVGYNYDVGGLVVGSFWDTETSGMDVSDGGTGKTTEEMMLISTFYDTETEGLDTPWDIIEIEDFDLEDPTTWYVDESNDYPRLFWEFEGYDPGEGGDDESSGRVVFHPDRRCHWKKPESPDWIKLEPMVKDGVSGMNLTWVQYDADKINIKIDDGTGKYPWKIEKTSNDGHEFLPNVSSWQNIMIKPINHCKEGEYSLAVSHLAYPYGWYGQSGNKVALNTNTLGYSTKSAVLGTSTESGETPSEETPMVPETGSSDILYLTTSLSIIGFSIYLVLNGKSRRFALRDFERKVSRGL